MFRNKLDYWMIERGLKNKHIAKKCNVSEQTFSSWRKNKTQPDLHSAAIIAKELNLSVDDLYEWEEEE